MVKSEPDLNIISIDAIKDAAERISDFVVRTPLLESSTLNERLDARILVKPETLQQTGSFKFRGAYTKISRIDPEVRKRGVVAYSSGNHAQGVAYAAALHGCHAVIVMPTDAPEIKIENTRNYGAEVILYDRYAESREEIGKKIRDERGATLVPPYDDWDVISGQGTVGLEIIDDLSARGISANYLVSPCGGGGLISGAASAVHQLSPETKIWGVEPLGFDDTRKSLDKGKRIVNSQDARTICDSLAAPEPGEITFSINSHLLSGCTTVADVDVADAMVDAFKTFKIVVEPGGAIALSSILNGQLDIRGQVVVVICSGGNVDLTLFNRILSGDRNFFG